ncbi:NCS2 family permease [Aestuariibacter halophilus]|uniref:NCS2 family permease n=1 Tax=Fluctibacter halophilus TaxID=226011 RepID=A0ABS8G6K8_9ALTE|nr:NCS2 family permease [Aestuariibacter halophilus]MCC2615731.1 NCS2 family permease [Aestuariibacter halophilus]
MGKILEHWFNLKAHNTTPKTELVAGLTTFAAMSYILVVNPAILGISGMPVDALITVTALAACIGTVIMALRTNYPIAMAPGMGLNAFFAYTICLARDIPWDAALGIVFYNGVLFLLLSVTGVRKKIADAIPKALKIGVQCGIGLFIAFIGLKNAGLIVAHPATLVSIGDLSEPVTLLALAGIILTIVMVSRGYRSAILLSIILLTSAGLFIPHNDGMLTATPEALIGLPAPIDTTFLAMDLTYPLVNLATCWDLIFALLFVNMFDTIGTLIGVSRKANLLDKNEQLPKMGQALSADAGASVVGAALGTSPVTSYVESAAGVSVGGRTGLTALVVGLCFLLALLFTPVMLVIPLMATTPALVMVGIYMLDGIKQLDFEDLPSVATATIALIAMPLTFSISEGIALGFITYVGVMMGCGKRHQVSPLAWAMALIFLARYVFSLM